MNHLLQQLYDLQLYVVAVVVFGFVPGFVLRLVLFLYPSDDHRRRELPAELYALPRWKRPMWVAEQLETAIFEGPKERKRSRARRRREAIQQAEPEQTGPPTWDDDHLALIQLLTQAERLAARAMKKASRREAVWGYLNLSRSRTWHDRWEAARRDKHEAWWAIANELREAGLPPAEWRDFHWNWPWPMKRGD